MDLDEILETFDALIGAEERYGYLIELGKDLPPLDDALKTEAHRVHGCQSRVWMVAGTEGDTLRLRADSDAFIVRGLIAILMAIYDGQTLRDAAQRDPVPVFAQIGLDQQLSMGRRNGLYSMVQRIQALAGALG